MLNVVSSEPVSRDTQAILCSQRKSHTLCLQKALRWERSAGKSCQVWSSVTLRFRSDLKPWMNLREAVRLTQAKALFNGTCFYRSFLFVSLTPKPCYATEMPWAIQPLSRVISQGVWSLENTRWKAGDPSSGPRQSVSSPHAKIVGLWETTFCGYTVLNDTKTLLHGHRLAELLTLFSWGCNLQKKQQKKNSAIFNNLYSF